MRAGNLKRRITIEVLTNGQDSFGGESGVWSEFVTNVPAEYLPVSGKEIISAGQEMSQATTMFKIRYYPGILASMRIRMDDRLFKIVSPPINPRGSNRELQILTTETL